jgi:predicted PurR-regulated permease PerM
MNKVRLLLSLVLSVLFAVLTDLVASGLEQKYELINNQARWIFVIVTFVVSFLVLVGLEYRNAQKSQGRPSVNKLIAGLGAKTGKITMTAKGTPPDTDVNTADLGPKTETTDIEMNFEESDAD